MKPSQIQMVDLLTPHQRILPEIEGAVSEVFHSSAFIEGAVVAQFQQNLAYFVGSRHVVTCGSGTDALQIAFMALRLRPGDEVLTTPFTFVATAEVLSLLQLKPVFVDVVPDTFNIDVSKLENAITPRTRAIVPVHLFGQCADMEPILRLAKAHNLFVVEDACQAIGAEYTFSDGRVAQAGTMGDFGCTSFFPSKNLGCFGDGGALFTQNESLAASARQIAHHGATLKYHHECVGINSRLDSVQAAVLDVKLKHLPEYMLARRQAAQRYDALLEKVNSPKVQTPVCAANSTHVYHQYTLKINDLNRNQLQQQLKDAGVPSMIYYPIPLHLQPAFAYLNYQRGDFPVAERLADSVLSLPMHTELNEETQRYIVEKISDWVSR